MVDTISEILEILLIILITNEWGWIYTKRYLYLGYFWPSPNLQSSMSTVHNYQLICNMTDAAYIYARVACKHGKSVSTLLFFNVLGFFHVSQINWWFYKIVDYVLAMMPVFSWVCIFFYFKTCVIWLRLYLKKIIITMTSLDVKQWCKQ